jgi:hypothetical protein
MKIKKYNTVVLARVVENLGQCETNEDVVLAMLEDDDVVVSTMTINLQYQLEHTPSLQVLGIMPERKIKDAKLDAAEWGYYIQEEYPGWVVTKHYNK